MRFSDLLSHLSDVTDASPRHLAGDPEIRGAAALDQAASGQLSFLEPGNALAATLRASGASAVLIPLRGEEAEALRQQATDRGLAWVALADPRLLLPGAIGAVVAPAGALGGGAVLACAERGVPLFAVANPCLLEVTAGALGLPALAASSYGEAAGLLLALREGISPAALSRPLAPLVPLPS